MSADKNGTESRDQWLKTMEGPLTVADLEAIETAERAASPAPWVRAITPEEWTQKEIADNHVSMVMGGGPRAHFCIHPDDVGDEQPRVTAMCGNGPTSEANARFLEVARCAIPMLVREVRRLRSSVPGTTPPGVPELPMEAREFEMLLAASVIAEQEGNYVELNPETVRRLVRSASPGTTETGRDAEWVVCEECSREVQVEQAHVVCVDCADEDEEPGTTETGTRDLRDAAQAVVDAYRIMRERGNFAGFWNMIDNLAEQLDGRALPVSRGEATTCDDHRPNGPDPVPGCRCASVDRLVASPSPGSETPRGAEARCPGHYQPFGIDCDLPAGHAGDHQARVAPGDNHAEKEE